MKTWKETRAWIEANRDICIEALRIYLGIGLFLKGLYFLSDQGAALEFQPLVGTAMAFVSVHVVGLTHIAGGLLLALGLLTRLSAIVQIPILFGAVAFVHWSQGLFSSENLEFTLLVLFLLIIFAIYGGGRFSLDALLSRRARALGSDD